MTATVHTGTRRLLGPVPVAPLPHLGAPALLELAEACSLTGRGGAGFPTSVKLRAVAGHRPVVVGNALEGEPLSGKDAVLLSRSAGLVLDGLTLAGTALGARRLLLATGPDVDPTALEPAARARGIEVQRVPGGFVAGQESALVSRLSGGPGLPRDPQVRVTTRGVDGKPTLVSNVETLAQLALAARYGAEWFRSVGTAEDPGTSLFTITGSVRRPGVVEAPRGSRLVDVLAGAKPVDPVAVLVGGYHGAWVTRLDVPLTRSALAPYSAAVGAGVLHVLGAGSCPLRATADIVRYLAAEGARQCGPCVNGLPRMAAALSQLAAGGRDPGLPRELERLVPLVSGRGACAHPDGTARLVASTLRTFAAHVDAHLVGRCPA